MEWVVSDTYRPRFTPQKGPAVHNVQKAGSAPEFVWTQQQSKAVPLHAMMTLGGRGGISFYSFLISTLDRGEWSASHPGRAFTPEEGTPGTRCTGGWVGPRAGLDTEARVKFLCPRRGSNPDRPVVQSAGHSGYRKNILPLPGIEPRSSSV
jgi:hypothetical protein